MNPGSLGRENEIRRGRPPFQYFLVRRRREWQLILGGMNANVSGQRTIRQRAKDSHRFHLVADKENIMVRKMMFIVVATGLVLSLAGSTAMAQTVYPSDGRGTLNPQPLPPGGQVYLNPQPLPPGYVYRPGVQVVLNPQPLPPAVVYRPAYPVVYPSFYAGFYPGYYGHYRFRR
jgi:hypothetical protein